MIKGDFVQWMSHSRGTSELRVGRLIAFIPAGSVPSKISPFLNDISRSGDKLGNGVHGTSQSDRWLVKVERVGKQGQNLTPWYYAPRASALQLSEYHYDSVQ